MSEFERFPYPSPESEEVESLSEAFLILNDSDDYTIEHARNDAYMFLNSRNAVASGFVDSISRTNPDGSLTFYLSNRSS